MKIRILVGYHKKYTLLKNDIFVPIQLGKTIANKKSKDGYLSPIELKWLNTNLLGDDTGDNISEKNREYCELTGIYWAWRNYEKLGNPDYIGFMHYRRWFDFLRINERKEKSRKTNSSKYISEMNEELFNNLLGQYKAGAPQYDVLQKEYAIHMNTGVIEILKKKYLRIYESYVEQINNGRCFYKNMFILSKSDFFELCSMLFDVLRNDKSSDGIPREKGYIAEYLTSAYLESLCKRYGGIAKFPECAIFEPTNSDRIKLVVYKILELLAFGERKHYYKNLRNKIKWG